MDSNDDLQANHHILKNFEHAKNYNDQILDSLPGFYAVFSNAGEVLRGNRGLAEIMGLNFESLHLYNVFELLKQDESRLLQEKIGTLKESVGADISFEMSLPLSDGKKRDYLFLLKAERLEDQTAIRFFTLIGQDVTEVKSVAVEYSRMQSELKTAQAVQALLIPQSGFHFEGISVTGFYASASECSGDWWYYNKIGGKIYIWLGDVTGHGVAAALIVAAIRTAVGFFENETELKPSDALARLSDAVIAVSKEQKYMSFFVASVDPHSGECWYSIAGHPAPMVGRQENGVGQVRSLTGLPSHLLGTKKDLKFEDHFVQLQKGDFLIAYTDGLYEVSNDKNIEFGIQRFNRTVKESCFNSHGDPQLVSDRIIKAINEYSNNSPLKDDQTMVILYKD